MNIGANRQAPTATSRDHVVTLENAEKLSHFRRFAFHRLMAAVDVWRTIYFMAFFL
jgi:hypothetical protein